MAKRFIIIGAGAFLVGAVLWLVAGPVYWRSTKIHFVVPTGFRGYFKIVEDHEHDQAVVDTDGVYQFTVPEDGVLRLRTMSRLMKHVWFVSASFDDDTVLRAPDSSPALDDTVALSNATQYSSGDIWFWIGPGSELQQKYDRHEWPHEVGVGRIVETSSKKPNPRCS